MSKCYVIKNKEGKYYRYCLCDTSFYKFNDKNNPEFCDNLSSADFFDSIKDAKSFIAERFFNFNAKKFTIVPITICEGDLEEENRNVILKELESIKEMIEYKQSGFGLMTGFANKNSRIYKDLCAKYDACSEILKPIYEKISVIQQAKESEKDDAR